MESDLRDKSGFLFILFGIKGVKLFGSCRSWSDDMGVGVRRVEIKRVK